MAKNEMAEKETRFQAIERIVLQTAIVLLLVLTLIRIVWSEAQSVRESINESHRPSSEQIKDVR